MLILADTNVLLRAQSPGADHHLKAKRALSQLRLQGDQLCIAAQNLIEFWAVATRAAEQNGLGLSIAEARAEMNQLLRLFRLLEPNSRVFAEWRRLVTSIAVVGKQSHDAHIAATMMAHGVAHIVTFNVRIL